MNGLKVNKQEIAAKAVLKYRKGVSISDQELDYAINELKSTVSFLDLLDDRYRLMKFDMILLLDQMKSSKECRLEYDRKNK